MPDTAPFPENTTSMKPDEMKPDEMKPDEMKPVRLLLVDDQPMVRGGLGLLIGLRPHLQVVGQAAGGREAVALAEALAPDLVLMDMRMPEGSGVEAARELAARGGPPVLLLTTFEEAGKIAAGLAAGAAGFLFKNVELADLERAIADVLAGKQVIDPRAAQLLAQHALKPPEQTLHAPLTGREQEVLNVLARGLSNKQIARELGISGATVKTHLSNLLHKLQARSRTEAVHRARELGLL